MEIKRCISCMEDMSSLSGSVCPHCGFDNSDPAGIQPPYAMKPNTIIHGRYLVGKVLGQGGFGITYIGFDLVLNVKVAIKEYFPMGMATREQSRSNTLIWSPTQVDTKQRQDGYENFLKEARKTAKIDSIPSIVRVRDTFLENETAYIIMDFVEGVTLKDRLTKNGTMTVSDCIKLLSPMMEGLAQVHKMGIIHRDISPDNIIVQPDGKLKLLDLGAAKDMSSGQGQSQLVTKKGFSPLEQYTESGQIGPWTDVYALCATIYYCITGQMIPSALDRMGQENITFPAGLKEALPAHVEAALRAGLSIESKNRIQSVDELLERLNGVKEDSKTGTDAEKAADTGEKIQKAKGRSKKKKIFIGGAAALLAIIILGVIGGSNSDPIEPDPGPEPTTETEMEPEANGVSVELLGTTSANLLNYGGNAMFEGEYEYFIEGDNALYVCPYDAENQTFYPNSDAEKVCDFAGYITLSDADVYFLATIVGAEETNAVCRMDKDGSNMEQLYSVTDGRSFRYLQYAKFSDQKEYLYFMLENEEGGYFSTLYRCDLETKETEAVIDGDLYWYNLYGDGIYYTEVAKDGDAYLWLEKSGLAGEDPQKLDTERSFSSGFIAEDTLYLTSLRDEAVLVCDLDGTQKSGYEGFYNLDIDFTNNIGYGDGWLYYTGAEDQNLHRVRANGTGDSIFVEGHTAVQICYGKGWLWFIEAKPTEKTHQYQNQMYYVGRDGSGLFEVGEPEYTWALTTATTTDFQFEESEDGNGIVITGYSGPLSSFSIPDTIDGKTVVGIGERAFQESGVEEIGLPEGIRSIGEYAFYKCENLTLAGLPEGLEEIGFGAFGACKKLENIDLPESLVLIDSLAFAESMLSYVYIPARLENIGSGAFAVSYGAGLTEFVVSDDNPSFLAYEGVLYQIYNENMLLLLACPPGYSGSFEIPDVVAGLHYFAFAHCRGLTQLVIPESVLVIGENAFMDVGFSEITVNQSCKLPEDFGSDITVNYY